MPGFVNTHTHIPMTLMRGYGGGHNLQDWLNQYIFPAEAKLDDRAVAAGTGLGPGGDDRQRRHLHCRYVYAIDIRIEVLDAGISANLSCGGVYFGPPEDFSPDTCAGLPQSAGAHGKLARRRGRADPGGRLHPCRVHLQRPPVAVGWRTTPENTAWVCTCTSPETRSEHEQCLARHGKTPIQTLDQYGVWDVRAIAAHCVYTTPEDWAVMAEKGVSCVHNPYSI